MSDKNEFVFNRPDGWYQHIKSERQYLWVYFRNDKPILLLNTQQVDRLQVVNNLPFKNDVNLLLAQVKDGSPKVSYIGLYYWTASVKHDWDLDNRNIWRLQFLDEPEKQKEVTNDWLELL